MGSRSAHATSAALSTGSPDLPAIGSRDGEGPAQAAVDHAVADTRARISGIGAVGWTQASEADERLTAKKPVTCFTPYDDVTLTGASSSRGSAAVAYHIA
jgi:hypothetical protein